MNSLTVEYLHFCTPKIRVKEVVEKKKPELLVSAMMTKIFVCRSQVQIYSGTKAAATKFVTSGVDGRVVIWDVKVRLPCNVYYCYYYYCYY